MAESRDQKSQENQESTLDLSDITGDLPVSDEPDPETSREMDAWDRARLVGLIQDIKERKIYARRAFCLVSAWLAGVFFLLLLQGFLSSSGVFDLADAVLLAVVGGTTLNVIGIFLVVARYLFPKR